MFLSWEEQGGKIMNEDEFTELAIKGMTLTLKIMIYIILSPFAIIGDLTEKMEVKE